jgi:hypothetical protein
MPTTPSKAGQDGLRAPRPALIVPHAIDDEAIPLSRIGPAGLMSVVFHAILLTAFVLLAPSGQAVGPTESVVDVSIDPSLDDDSQKPEFLSDDVNRFAEKSDFGINNDSRHQAEITIPFEDTLEEKIGRPDGSANAPPTSVLPPPGRGDSLNNSTIQGQGPAADLSKATGANGPFTSNIQDALQGRKGSTKEFLLNGWGNKESEAAVAKGLAWLARVQSANGAWKLDGNFPDRGATANDVGATALGLLPFLGAGYTHKERKNNPYDKTIEKALSWLIAVQDKRTGAFSGDMYAHGLAAIAMSEAFALSQDYNLKKPAQFAINHIVTAQHAAGGWRYKPGQAGDTSVSGWQIMALKSGLLAGLDVPGATIRKAQSYLDSVTQSATEGSGYLDPNTPTPTMTAVSLLCRQYLNGWGRQNLRLIKGVDNYIKPNPPQAAKKDAYYYYYATQVMHNFGGDDWKAWNTKMRDLLVASQEVDSKKPETIGSWSPVGDQWGQTGGRLMVTSLNILTLEVYYRYLPLYSREM